MVLTISQLGERRAEGGHGGRVGLDLAAGRVDALA